MQRARDGSCDVYPPKGAWIGARRDVSAAMQGQDLTLEAGDRLILYTDGLIEAMDADKNQFGLDRVLALIDSHAKSSESELCEVLVEAAQRFAVLQEDDITVVVLRYAPTGA